jgi:hypothetical protein
VELVDPARFNTCFNQIRTAIWNMNLFPTVSTKVNEIIKDLKAYNANNPSKQQVVFNITVDAWDGAIQDFVNCGNM